MNRSIKSYFHNFYGGLCNANSFFIYFTTQIVKAPSQYLIKEERIFSAEALFPSQAILGFIPQGGGGGVAFFLNLFVAKR